MEQKLSKCRCSLKPDNWVNVPEWHYC